MPSLPKGDANVQLIFESAILFVFFLITCTIFETDHNMRFKLIALLSILLTIHCYSQDNSSLLFYLSGDNQVKADYAAGQESPSFVSNVSIIDDGQKGKGIRCELGQRLAYKAPGNIFSERGTLAFWWRAHEPYGPTEFPIFRVSFSDHSSWDMVWLRIDYNGHGLDAFVTDNNLVRVRVSTSLERLPEPDEWSHIAFSWDENKGIKLYFNGQMIARKDTSVVLNTGLDQFGPHSRIISPYQVQSAYNMQRGGDIDELRIYSQALDDNIIGEIAGNEVPDIPAARRSFSDQTTSGKWLHYYGFDTQMPPYLTDASTTVRKVGILESYDLKRWWYKGNDGIRETTWPGVYNRSRIEGRNDYFQLPDWDCYSSSGIQIRYNMPDELWNYVEMSGGAFGKLGISENLDGSADNTFDTKAQGTQHSFHKLAEPVQGKTLVFTNEVQETPIQELDTYYIHAGEAPAGITRLSYMLDDFQDYNFPQLVEVRKFIEGRFDPQERQMLLGRAQQAARRQTPRQQTPRQQIPSPAMSESASSASTSSSSVSSESTSSASASSSSASSASTDNLPIVHVVIPSDWRDININQEVTISNTTSEGTWDGPRDGSTSWRNIRGGLDGILIDLPALDVEPVKDGLIPINIQVKDPIWKMRNMFDFSFSVRPGEKRTLWLDLRDRILPDDEPLYITFAGGSADFDARSLKGTGITLVFKNKEEAKKEHAEDRFAQVRDGYAMLVEESTSSRRYSKFEQVDRDLNDLIKIEPDNQLYRRYWNLYYPGQSPLDYIEPVAPANIPEWAFVQLEVLKKYREIIEWYIDNRQLDYGEFGGGISDDTDLTNHFPGLYYIGDIREKVATSLHLFMDAVDREGTLTNGVSTIMTDGLHTYEEGENTLCQINYTEAGNPRQAERLMENTRTIRDWVMGINKAGHLHFRSDYWSATRLAEEWPWTMSSYRENFHTGPALMLGEFYGNPAAREFMLRYADSILAHKRYDESGQVVIPSELDYATDEPISWGIGYLGALYNYAYAWTGEEKYAEIDRVSDWWSPEMTREQSVTRGRQILRNYFNRDFITTEGSIWIDRLSFDVNYIQTVRLGGIGMNRSQQMVPGNLFRWEFPGDRDAEKVAIFVHDRSKKAFKIDFYNTDKKPMKVDMIGVELLGGDWELTAEGKTRTHRFGRDRRISLTIPAGKEYCIEMKLKGEGRDFNLLPDIGISTEDIELKNGMVEVTVHNIGGVDSETMDIVLMNSKGRIVAAGTIPPIKAPVDLSPKTATISLPLPENSSPESLKVIIDPENKVEEIYESNNCVIRE